MHKSFNELLKDQKFSKAYNKVQAQKNNAAKTVMEEQYQFTIADKPVKIVQSENGTTYTLLINRAIDDANTFENLVIKYENDGSINATIINYQPFYPLNTMDYFTNSAFNGLQSVTPIVYNDALVSTTGKISSDCYSVCTILCHDLTESGPYSVPHPPGSSCTGYNITIDCVVTCWGDNIGGEDTGNDIGTVDNTSGGGTSSSTNSGNVSTPPNNCGNCNNPIETIPVLELEDDLQEPKTPCEILKNQTEDNLEIKHKLDSLKQRVLLTNPNRDTTETIVNIERVGLDYEYRVSNSNTIGNTLLSVQGIVSNRDVASIHNHPEGIPVFSFVDIVNYYYTYNFVHESRKNEYTDYLVCFNGTTYALRMENVTALNTLFAGLDLGTAQGREDANNIILEIQKDYGLSTDQIYDQAMAEELFMNVINDTCLGGGSSINLYRKDSDGWGKLVKNGTTITKEPCPQ